MKGGDSLIKHIEYRLKNRRTDMTVGIEYEVLLSKEISSLEFALVKQEFRAAIHKVFGNDLFVVDDSITGQGYFKKS